MRIALAIPPLDPEYAEIAWDADWGWWQPLGLLSIASYLRHHIPDIEIMILDEQVASLDEMTSALSRFKPDWLGVSPDSVTYRNSLSLARLARSLGSRVVFGGNHATNLGAVILKNQRDVDFVIAQDGERAMLELIKGERPERISNLVRRDGAGITANPVVLGDLDELPDTDYSLVDLDAYYRNYLDNPKQKRFPQPFRRPLTMSAQRGCKWRQTCPGGCIFCSCVYPTWRGRSPEKVWREIMRCQERLGTDALVFGEDDFLAEPAWFEEFYRRRPSADRPGIRFLYARPDDIDQKTAAQLAELGCHQVFMGFESGDAVSLSRLRKGLGPERLRDAARILTRQGIWFNPSFALGAPGESARSLCATTELAEELSAMRVNGCNVYPLVPLPGSHAWRMALEGSESFRRQFAGQDFLEPPKLAKEWAARFCQVGIGEIATACARINALFGQGRAGGGSPTPAA